MSRTSALTRKPKGLGRRNFAHEVTCDSHTDLEVKSQGHGVGAYCGGHLAAQLVSSYIVPVSLSLFLVLCLIRQVQTSNDASLLYHELFSLYVHISRRCSSSSLSSYHSVSHEFLSLTFCLLTLYAEGIHFSTHDLTNLSVFVGECSSSFC